MELSRAKELLTTLADGVNPLTGEILEPSELCNQGEIVRALYTVLSALDTASVKKYKQPENAGKPWSKEDDALLSSMFDAGQSKRELCRHFQRTQGSIAARLVRLGKIADRETFRNLGDGEIDH